MTVLTTTLERTEEKFYGFWQTDTVIENRKQVWPNMGQNFKYLSTPVLYYMHQKVNFDFSSDGNLPAKIYDYIIFRRILLNFTYHTSVAK